MLLLVLGGVLAHRLYLVLSTDFPINDGGPFLAYIEATEQTFPGLPSTVSYNGLDLPYAYPPAAFWLGALLAKFGVSAVGVLHVLPGLMNAAWLGLLALLFLREGQSRMFAAGAVAVVAVAFRSYEWLVMGGGLTRGLGAVFFVLGLVALGRTRGREPSPLSKRTAVLAGLCVAGAVLSHLEWGILAAASVVVQRAVCSASLKNFFVTTAVAGSTAAVCVAPWVLVVLSWHGLEPFLAASASSSWDLQATIDRVEGFTRLQWPNLLMAVGGIVLLAQRHLFWPTFILLCLVLTPRHSFTPLVLAVGYLTVSGLEAVVRVVRRTGSPWRELPEAAAVAALALVVVVPSVQTVERTRMVNPSFSPLSQDVRAAMSWVRDEHATSSFAVVTDPHWSYDASAEWFPELSGATSSTTVQGTEWLPGDAFLRKEREVMSMKVSPTCEEFVQRILALAPVDYVWTQTRLECFQAPAFSRVFSNPDVAIFAVS